MEKTHSGLALCGSSPYAVKLGGSVCYMTITWPIGQAPIGLAPLEKPPGRAFAWKNLHKDVNRLSDRWYSRSRGAQLKFWRVFEEFWQSPDCPKRFLVRFERPGEAHNQMQQPERADARLESCKPPPPKLNEHYRKNSKSPLVAHEYKIITHILLSCGIIPASFLGGHPAAIRCR